MNDLLRRKWHDLLGAWAVTPSVADEMFEDIRQHYAGPGSFYHTLDHIGAMLETVESLASHAPNLNAVKLAAWLHDVIYDSRASDNEERSADYAERLCEQMDVVEGSALLLRTNQPNGFDCPGCAWPDSNEHSTFQFCENGGIVKFHSAGALDQWLDDDGGDFRRLFVEQAIQCHLMLFCVGQIHNELLWHNTSK